MSKITIIKRKIILLLIWYILMYILSKEFDTFVCASNEEIASTCNNMDNKRNNNYSSGQNYLNIQLNGFMNNSSECLTYEEQSYNPYNVQDSSLDNDNMLANDLEQILIEFQANPYYVENLYGSDNCIPNNDQPYNPYTVSDSSLNSNSTLTENLPELLNSNIFNPCSIEDSYNNNNNLYTLNNVQTYNPHNIQNSSLNNILPNENLMNPEIIYNQVSTSIDYLPNEYILFESNSAPLACNNIEPDSSNSLLFLQPPNSSIQQIESVDQNLESTQVSTSTNRKRVYRSNNDSIDSDDDSDSDSIDSDDKFSRILFITSSIENLDRYKHLVTELHNYKLSCLENEQAPESISIALYGRSSISYKSEFYPAFIISIMDNIKKYNNIWMALYMSKKKFIDKKMIFIYFLTGFYLNDREFIFNDCNLSYYPGLFLDLSKIRNSGYNIAKKFISKNNLTVKSDGNVTKLSDIYAKRNINLLWHAESMLVSYGNWLLQFLFTSTSEVEKEWNLQRQLLLILCIPEIYEDLFYMEYEEIDLLRKRILASSLKQQYKSLCDQFCIIEYLYGKVHNNSKIMHDSYQKILKIKMNVSLYKHTDIGIYQLVYKLFAYFYKYSFHLYKTHNNDHINNPSFLEHNDNNYLYMRNYTKIHSIGKNAYQGKGVILETRIKIYSMLFKYNNAETNNRTLDNITEKKMSYVFNWKNHIVISYTPHYHVKFVDNSTHGMYVIHLPFFVTTKNGTTTYHYIHTIEEIVKYIIDIFYSTTINSNKKSRYNVYPFKYNRQDKTWSIITRRAPKKDQIKKRRLENSNNICDMDKTIEEMHNDGFDVVFYYIKENIKTTEFVFAQFNPIDAETINAAYRENEEEAKKLFDGYMPNNDAPRIPLFLPRIMTSAVHFGPYVLKPEKYKIIPNEDYQNPVAIEFSNWLDIVVKRKDLKLTTIELLKKFRHEIYYYSDFYILDLNTLYEDCDCYSMEVKQKELNEHGIELSWNAKKQLGIGEYTNYLFDIKSRSFLYSKDQNLKKIADLFLFLKMLQRKHASQDMLRYGICIYSKKAQKPCFTVVPLLCPEMKNHMNDLFCEDHEMHHMLSPRLKENIKHLKKNHSINISDVLNISKLCITIKDVNYTKSKLGLHYTIMNSMF
ncbi:hypothetical protein NEIRO03_2002 [Nematocida sp. AWRm78]|nr:hypothetical protein NEIRO03_2002 [Nematocida sp. AWRm78]